MIESFLVSLFVAIGKQLALWGLLKASEIVELERKLKKAREYQKVVNKPGNTREERRSAEDDLLS